MRDQGIWSVSLVRWSGVQVRLHMFFLIFAAFTIYLSYQEASSPAAEGYAWIGVVGVLVLLCSVIVHELGHVAMASRLGAHVDEVVLGPLGGLGPPPGPLEPPGELMTAVAGPMANLVIVLLAAMGLLISGNANLIGLLHPFAPVDVLSGAPLLVGLKLTLWVNWLLLLLNLIPAFPFDGGRVVRAGLLMMHPRSEPQRASWAAARVAKLTSVVLVVIALLSFGTNPGYPVQTWFALMLLAIFVYFSAKKEESISQQATSYDALFGYDFSAGYTSLEQSAPKCSTKPATGPLVRWWNRRRELREQRQREIEATEDGRVDEILARVYESGLDSLSTEDRELLQRVSVRYRHRPR